MDVRQVEQPARASWASTILGVVAFIAFLGSGLWMLSTASSEVQNKSNQLVQAQQEIAGLKEQVAKLTADVKILSEKAPKEAQETIDRINRLETQIGTLKAENDDLKSKIKQNDNPGQGSTTGEPPVTSSTTQGQGDTTGKNPDKPSDPSKQEDTTGTLGTKQPDNRAPKDPVGTGRTELKLPDKQVPESAGIICYVKYYNRTSRALADRVLGILQKEKYTVSLSPTRDRIQSKEEGYLALVTFSNEKDKETATSIAQRLTENNVAAKAQFASDPDAKTGIFQIWILR